VSRGEGSGFPASRRSGYDAGMRVPRQVTLLAFPALGVLAPGALLSAAPVRSFFNPLLPRRADPWILRHSDGFYYFSAPVPE
jgi:beta-galactosidase